MPRSQPLYNIDPRIKLARNIGSGTFAFKDLFEGFENIPALQEIFGKSGLKEELRVLTVEVFPREGFMGVSDEDGHIFASQHYLNNGDEWSVYLDVVHELVHVMQFHKGKNLFDPNYAYVDRPTEREAYKVGVKEARRIGLTDKEIFDYLEVPWISREEHVRLAVACGVEAEGTSKK